MARKTVNAPANSHTASAVDLLNQLNDLVPTKQKPKAGAKSVWEVPLDGAQAEILRRWVSAKNVSEFINARLENSKEELCEFALNMVADSLFKTKNRPLNPNFIVRNEQGQLDSKAVYLFTDKFKYRFPEVPDGVNARDHFVDVFVNLGIEETDAENLVDNELDLNPITGFVSLTELTQGKYGEGRQFIESSDAEKSAGKKLLQFLTAKANADGNVVVESLTPEEKGLVIRRESGIKVKAGFYSRVCTYVHSVEQLKAVFKVIIPIAYPSHQKFGVNDPPTVRSQRLISAAAEIIGVEVSSEEKED